MNGWGLFALVVIAVLVVVVVVWFGTEYFSARTRRRFLAQYADRSVAGIQARVEGEREQERVSRADTEVLPVVPADEVPTEVLPAVSPLPRRKRPYVGRPPTPYPRKPAQRPEVELMQRVLDGLKRL